MKLNVTMKNKGGVKLNCDMKNRGGGVKLN